MGNSHIEHENLEIEDPIGQEEYIIDVDTRSDIKTLSEPHFLKRVLWEHMGNGLMSDYNIVLLSIHAVFLQSGFVGFDSVSGLRVDLFDLRKEQASFTKSITYTLPQLLSGDNDAELIVLKFQTLRDHVNAYGSLANSPLGLHKLNVDGMRFLPAIITFYLTIEGCDMAKAEKGIFELWKFVKDGLVLPMLIELCERTGLDLPPCLIRLPKDLKFRILELLPGQDIARVACVCKEMKCLSSNKELWKAKYMSQWKEKYMSEFGSGCATGVVESHTHTINWKRWFVSSWENTKKRKRKGRVPQPFPRHGSYSFGNPQVRGAQLRQPARLIRRASYTEEG
ncbi:F-box family protein [Euphorbia peplus]|nr:F-box family protein [Euphorbia peplus]